MAESKVAKDEMEVLGEALQRYSAELAKLADKAITRYWEVHFEENLRREPKDRSLMGCRIRKLKGDDFYVEWYRNTWKKTRPGNKPYSVYIQKGAGFRYPQSHLAKYAKPWEIEIIGRVEDVLAQVRETQKALTTARRAIEALDRRMEKTREMVEELRKG